MEIWKNVESLLRFKQMIFIEISVTILYYCIILVTLLWRQVLDSDFDK